MNQQPDRTYITVTIEAPARAGDGSGGKTVTFAAIAGSWSATQHFYGASSLARLEQGNHNTDGPGVETRVKQLFVFRGILPTGIRREYRIVSPDGNKYSVLFVRAYDGTLQVDTELVQ